MHRTGLFRIVLLAVLTALLLTGVATLVLRASWPDNGVEILLPSPASREAVVYVTGAVAHPGLYTLRAGDRAADAVEAAGGMTETADTARANLAARLADGDHVHIPAVGEATPPPSGPPLLDLNTATALELEQLPGIGGTRAQSIMTFRQAHGAFTRVEDLLQVDGIGVVTLDRLRPLVTVK